MKEKNIGEEVREEARIIAECLPRMCPKVPLDEFLETNINYFHRLEGLYLNTERKSEKESRKYLKAFFSPQMNGKASLPPTARKVLEDFIKKRTDIHATKEKWHTLTSAYELFLVQARICPEVMKRQEEEPAYSVGAMEDYLTSIQQTYA